MNAEDNPRRARRARRQEIRRQARADRRERSQAVRAERARQHDRQERRDQAGDTAQATPETALTDEEYQAATKGVGGWRGRSLAAFLGAGIAGAALIGGPIALGIDQPVREDYVVAPAAQELHAEVSDPDNVLSDDEERGIVADAARIHAPEVVRELRYLVFAKNDSNVNDTVENYLRDNEPDLIGEDHFADGVLVVGVGLDPRQAFVFAGEDVADELRLRSDDDHLDTSINAIKPGVEDGNLRGGLFAGAHEAADAETAGERAYETAREDRTVGVVLGSVGGAVGGMTASGLFIAGRNKRARALAQARAELDLLTREYGELAGRLDAIDVRAHSLTSPLVDATLRRQWEEVRDRFLSLHDDVDRLGALQLTTPARLGAGGSRAVGAGDSPAMGAGAGTAAGHTGPAADRRAAEEADKALYERRGEITEAARAVRRVSYAEDNIDRLFRMENGDITVRREELQALREDIVAAQVEVKDAGSGLYRELQTLRERAEWMDSDLATREGDGTGAVASPVRGDAAFLDTYMQLLGDYRTALARLKDEKFDDVDADEATELRAPAIYEPDYRPGYGVYNFVPFWTMAAWHTSNAQTQAAAGTSGAVNTSFSSGFSGAGGSSSF